MQGIFGSNKVLRHLDRVIDWSRGGTPPPITVEFDLTGRCNHRCPACGGGRYEGTMDGVMARVLLDELAAYGVRGLMFSGGGEPLMHADFAAILRHAADRLPVGLITNGTLIEEQLAERIARACRWVRVSIDASDPRVYRQVHGMDEAHYAAAWRAVKLLAAAKRACGSDVTIGVSYMVDRRSRGGMVLGAGLARAVGADYIQFRPFWGGAVPIDAELRLCRNLETDRFRVLSAAQKYGRLDAPRNYATCHGSALAAVIQADGNVPLCCNLRGRPDWYLGNALEQPFRRIWDGPARARLLERLCVSQCVPLCRLDAINGVLEDLVTPKQHEEFL